MKWEAADYRKVMKQPIQYPALPLAKIGKQAWVPLERLVTVGSQKIPLIGHILKALHNWRKDHFDSGRLKSPFAPLADRLMKSLSKKVAT
jgi:hypothetical protein